jgi:hypothetical protein
MQFRLGTHGYSKSADKPEPWRREKCTAIDTRTKKSKPLSHTKSILAALNQTSDSTSRLPLPHSVIITLAGVLGSVTLKAYTCYILVESLNERLAAIMAPRDKLLTGGKHATHVDYSTISTTMEQQLDQHVPMIPRPSVFKRESFLVQVTTSRGPPEIMGIVLLYAFGFGSTIGIIPNLMASRTMVMMMTSKEIVPVLTFWTNPRHALLGRKMHEMQLQWLISSQTPLRYS